jgi:hypothetical protein
MLHAIVSRREWFKAAVAALAGGGILFGHAGQKQELSQGPTQGTDPLVAQLASPRHCDRTDAVT